MKRSGDDSWTMVLRLPEALVIGFLAPNETPPSSAKQLRIWGSLEFLDNTRARLRPVHGRVSVRIAGSRTVEGSIRRRWRREGVCAPGPATSNVAMCVD